MADNNLLEFFRKHTISIGLFILLTLNIIFIWHFNNKLVDIASSNSFAYYLNKDFMAQYYQIQSNWLNATLFALAIVLAVIGIIIPVFALNLFESKKHEMDIIISNAKKEANKTKGIILKAQEKATETTELIDKAQKQASETADIIAKTKEEAHESAKQALEAIQKEVMASQEQMKKDLAEVKEYVEIAKKSEKKAEANRYFAMGYNEKQNKKAIEYYEKAIELDPTMFESYCNLGNVYNKTGEYEKAIEYYCKGLEMNGDKKILYQNRGHAKLKLNKILEAIDDYKQVILLDSNFHNIYYDLSEAYIFSLNFKESIEALNQFVEKSIEPFIYEDDYEAWMKVLNEYYNEKFVQEIMKILDGKLTKKPRPLACG